MWGLEEGELLPRSAHLQGLGTLGERGLEEAHTEEQSRQGQGDVTGCVSSLCEGGST